MRFKAKGLISTQNGNNTVEVENVKYWISGMDMTRIAEFRQFKQGRRFSEMPEMEGIEVFVEVIRDPDDGHYWAQLTNQPTWCPLPYC